MTKQLCEAKGIVNMEPATGIGVTCSGCGALRRWYFWHSTFLLPQAVVWTFCRKCRIFYHGGLFP